MAKRLVVIHEGYGCETGCCGHAVRLNDDPLHDARYPMLHCGTIVKEMDFSHPYGEDFRAYAEEQVRAAGCDPADLDWEHSYICDD